MMRFLTKRVNKKIYRIGNTRTMWIWLLKSGQRWNFTNDEFVEELICFFIVGSIIKGVYFWHIDLVETLAQLINSTTPPNYSIFGYSENSSHVIVLWWIKKKLFSNTESISEKKAFTKWIKEILFSCWNIFIWGIQWKEIFYFVSIFSLMKIINLDIPSQ